MSEIDKILIRIRSECTFKSREKYLMGISPMTDCLLIEDNGIYLTGISPSRYISSIFDSHEEISISSGGGYFSILSENIIEQLIPFRMMIIYDKYGKDISDMTLSEFLSYERSLKIENLF